MAETRSSVIFNPEESMLTEYYGKHVDPEHFYPLISCHKKIQDSTSILHITTNLDAIIKSKQLLMSAGGLGGCLYGVPIFRNKAHNLGWYLIENELPMFLRNQGRTIDFNFIVANHDSPKWGCVDYMAFGEHYLNAFNESPPQMQLAIDLRNMNNIFIKQKRIIEDVFYLLKLRNFLLHSRFVEAIQSSLTLKMIYFETVLEYVFIFQDDIHAKEALLNSEIYNKNAKDMVFRLNPPLAQQFSLRNFNSLPGQLDIYFRRLSSQKLVFSRYKTSHFYEYVQKRLAFYIKYYLLDNLDNLRGHIIMRHFDQRPILEKYLAEKLWNESIAGSYTHVTYRMPKGEVGVLPVAGFDIFLGQKKEGSFTTAEKLYARSSRKLATERTVMRNPYTKLKIN